MAFFSTTRSSSTGTLTKFMYKVYGWMAVGLAATAATAFAVYANPVVFKAIFFNKAIFYGLLIAEFGLIISLSALIQKMNFLTAAACYLLYSVATGATLSIIFAVYQLPSIANIFMVSVAMFVVMALYGFFTKADLTKIGNILLMGLFGIVIAGLINLFFHNPMTDMICSILAVVIFTGLIAFDVQKIKMMWSDLREDGEKNSNKLALFGALTLYLDLINLFLNLLNLFGKKKN